MRTLIFAGLLLFAPVLCAQVNDAVLWTGLGVKADLTKDIGLSYETQGRFFQNISCLQNYYNELGVDYSPFKKFEVGVKYRMARKNRGNYFATENRFNIDAEYGYKLKPAHLDIKLRGRYQVAFNRLGVVNDIYPDIAHTARLKLKISYENKDFKRVQPFVSAEIFGALNPKNKYNHVDSYRLSAGFAFDLPKRLGVDLYYIYEREYHSVPNNNHIYVLQLNYSFKDKLLKKKKSAKGE